MLLPRPCRPSPGTTTARLPCVKPSGYSAGPIRIGPGWARPGKRRSGARSAVDADQLVPENHGPAMRRLAIGRHTCLVQQLGWALLPELPAPGPSAMARWVRSGAECFVRVRHRPRITTHPAAEIGSVHHPDGIKKQSASGVHRLRSPRIAPPAPSPVTAPITASPPVLTAFRRPVPARSQPGSRLPPAAVLMMSRAYQELRSSFRGNVPAAAAWNDTAIESARRKNRPGLDGLSV